MGAALTLTGSILLALVAVLIGLLFVPVDLEISASSRDGARMRVRWLFGMVRAGINLGARQDAPPEASAERARAKRPRAALIARRLAAIDGLGARVLKLVRELMGPFGRARGRVAVRAGFADPAETGELCGHVCSALIFLPDRPGWCVAFEPDFSGAVFEAEGEGAVRLVPARIVGACASLAVSRPGRRALREIVWTHGR